MSTNRDDARIHLDRLSAALASDADRLSDSELAEEVGASLGSLEDVARDVRAIFESAIAQSGKRRLAMARQGFESLHNAKQPHLLRLTAEAKRALLERVANLNSAIDQKFTLAAREGRDTQADVDGLLEDLVELGVIDDEGNIK